MLAGILLHIIKLKTTDFYEIHHYGDGNQPLTRRASILPISIKVNLAIENYKVPIKNVKNVDYRFRN